MGGIRRIKDASTFPKALEGVEVVVSSANAVLAQSLGIHAGRINDASSHRYPKCSANPPTSANTARGS